MIQLSHSTGEGFWNRSGDTLVNEGRIIIAEIDGSVNQNNGVPFNHDSIEITYPNISGW